MYRIVVATVYNSENCGSYFQAYALKTFLEKKGYQVYFLKRNVNRELNTILKHIKSLFDEAIRRNPQFISFTIGKWAVFTNLSRRFEICDFNSDFFEQADLIVIGSDTIWNFQSRHFRKSANRYIGNCYRGKKVITYAASAGNTSYELFHEVVSRAGGLRKISDFLVRDCHTKDLVLKETGVDAKVVCDPTLLLEQNDFGEFISHGVECDSEYILLYYFGKISNQDVQEIRSFANKNNLKIVSFCAYRKWCDINIPADPRKVLDYYGSAYAIITNTFHGVAFSIIYEKHFAVHEENKNKVKELLLQYGLQNRIYYEPHDIRKCLAFPFSDSDKQRKIQIKEKSIAALENSLQSSLGNINE